MKRFGLDSKKHASTLISSPAKLSSDPAGEEVDPTLYRSIIGSLLYLTTSRLDIAFSVEVCANFQAAPKKSHMIGAKRIIHYVNGISDYGIWYSRYSNECLTKYSDADWAECVDDRKSTSGGCFYLGNNLVLWMSKKQNSVSLLTAEAKYIATSSCCAQLLWMKKLLHDYEISQETMCVFCDNTSAINISKLCLTLKVKAYQNSISFHLRLGEREGCVWNLSTPQIKEVNIFTKPLDGPRFESLCKTISVGIIP